MNQISKVFCPMIIAAVAAGACAATDPTADPHHPAQAASPSVKKTTPATPNPAVARVDAQVKSMDEMHVKMMAARTPEERGALMAEHKKAMNDGMAMMGDMKTDTAARQQMMGKRMDMMQSMMQMMMDRLPAEPAN